MVWCGSAGGQARFLFVCWSVATEHVSVCDPTHPLSFPTFAKTTRQLASLPSPTCYPSSYLCYAGCTSIHPSSIHDIYLSVSLSPHLPAVISLHWLLSRQHGPSLQSPLSMETPREIPGISKKKKKTKKKEKKERGKKGLIKRWQENVAGLRLDFACFAFALDPAACPTMTL